MPIRLDIWKKRLTRELISWGGELGSYKIDLNGRYCCTMKTMMLSISRKIRTIGDWKTSHSRRRKLNLVGVKLLVFCRISFVGMLAHWLGSIFGRQKKQQPIGQTWADILTPFFVSFSHMASREPCN